MSGQSGSGSRARAARALAPLIVGLAAIIAAALLPFAPVLTEKTTVNWPEQGALPESTTALFVPYAPAKTQVHVPCDVLRAGQDREASTNVVSSQPAGAETTGFAVSIVGDDLLVQLGGQQVYRGAVPDGDCAVDLYAAPDGSTLDVGERTISIPDAHVREVNMFATDLDGEEANGLSVRAETSNWFENSPTGIKLALVAVQLALAASGLLLLLRADRRRRATERDATRGRRSNRHASWPRRMVDLGVLAALGAWAVLGPLSPDDSFTEGIVRNALDTGVFTNYFRWQNAAEAPFTLVLYLMEPLVALGANPLVLRLPSIVAAIASWLLLARGVLPVLLGPLARRGWVYGIAALGFLLWWMPFNLGARPEPFVALGTTAVLTCVLRGTRRTDNTGLALLGLAGLAGGLTLAVNPVGIVALAPVAVCAPRIWRTLRGSAASRASGLLEPIGYLALICGLGGVGLVAMFADQSWLGASRATELHQYYGPNLSWFQEFKRYQYLIGFDEAFANQGSMGRRLPVLLTLAVSSAAGLLLVRGARWLPGMRLTYIPIGTVAVALVLLSLTPSKWTHYFGALAGLGGAGLVCAVVLFCGAARHWYPYRAVQLIAAFGTVATVLAAAVAFAGKNTWFMYSDFGVPNAEGPFWPFNQPWLWLLSLVGVLVFAWVRAGWSVPGMFVRLPAVLSSAVALVGVLVLLVSFIVAPLRQSDGYSIGQQNIDTLFGGSCGVLDEVVAPRTAPNGVLGTASGSADATGFVRDGGFPDGSAPPDDPGEGKAAHLWGSFVDGPSGTGELTSQWFGLPQLSKDQELAISAAGRTGDGNQLSLEFGRSTGDGHRPVGTHQLDDSEDESNKRPDYPRDNAQQPTPQDNSEWRPQRVEASAVPAEADVVRVRAVDDTTDAGGWLAVTGPRILDVPPVREVLDERAAIYVDWSMLWTAPCLRNSPRAAHGLVETPSALLLPPADLGFSAEASFEKVIGGSFAGADRIGQREVVPTRLRGTEEKPQQADWGQFVRVSYPVQRDAYDTEMTSQWRWGWDGDPASISPNNE